MSKGSVGERVAVVETHVEQLLEDGLRREDTQRETLEEVKALREALTAIKDEMNRYKGFLGGAAWVITAMGVAVWKFAGPVYAWIMRIKTGGS
jgi:hypothetical protein